MKVQELELPFNQYSNHEIPILKDQCTAIWVLSYEHLVGHSAEHFKPSTTRAITPLNGRARLAQDSGVVHVATG